MGDILGSTLRTALVGAGAAAAGAAMMAWWSPQRASGGVPLSTEAAESRASRDEDMASLRARLARLESREQAAVAALAAASAASAKAQSPEDPGSAEVASREQRIARWMDEHYTTEVQGRVFGAYFADVDRVRQSERPDGAWATTVNRELRDLLEQTPGLEKTSVDRFDCGGTLCRLQVRVEQPRQRNQLLHAVQAKLHFDEASAFMPAGEGKMEAYLARQGATLPFFDQVKYVEAEMQ